MPAQTFCIIKQTGHKKFPYRLTISKGEEIFLDLFTQDRWPGAKGNIFCIRTAGRESISVEEKEIERNLVLNYSLFGKRLTLILDRPTKKRCSFLFLTKSYKTKEGEYEQIFWQTQQGLTGHRSKYKLAYSRDKDITIFSDTSERYAWNFPSANIVYEKLPIGDYAIKDNFGFLAIVERKTFANLMSEFGNLKKFHQSLTELEICKNSALVIEATYADFLDKNKIHPYTGNFGAKAIAEIQAAHPNLAFIFAGSRKLAIAWTWHFFMATQATNNDSSSMMARESVAKYGARKNVFYNEDQARRLIFTQMPKEFTTTQFRANLPEMPAVNIRRILDKLKNEGVLLVEKKGKDLVWNRIYD